MLYTSALFLVFSMACQDGSSKNTTDTAQQSDTAETIPPVEIYEGEGLMLPLLNFEGGELLWINHETGLVEQSWPHNMVHAQPWGNHIILLDENINGNSTTFVREIDSSGSEVRSFELPNSHHTISVVGDKLYYLYAERTGVPKIFDSVRWVDLNTDDTGILLDTVDVLDESLLTIGYSDSDITHANTLVWEPNQERFYLSFAGINAVWTFDISGQVDQVFLGQGADGEAYRTGSICTGGTFNHPHGGIGREPGELFVLSNQEELSEVLHYQCSETAFELVETYGPPYDGFLSLAGGNLALTESNLIINWGFTGVLESRVIGSQDRNWMYESDFGAGFGFMAWY